MKKLISIFLATSSLLLITGCGCSNKTETKDIDDNNYKDQVVIFDDQTVEKLIIKDMNIAYYDEISHIAFDIKNKNAEVVNYKEIVINFYSEDGTILYSANESVGEIASGESMSLYLNSDTNLSKATKVDYKIQ